MDPMDNELKKELARGPFSQNGFNDSLRKRIEERIDNHVAVRRPRRWSAWSAGVSAVLASALVFLFVTDSRPLPLVQQEAAEKPEMQHQPSAAAHAPHGPDWEASVRSALLIGLRSDAPAAENPQAPSTYRTVLIAPDRNRLQKTAEGEGILMPYKLDFWKIGNERKATGSQETYTLTAHLASVKPKTSGSADRRNPAQPVVRSEKLMFAGNRYVAVTQTTAAKTSAAQSPAPQDYVWVKELEQLASGRQVPAPLSEPHVALRSVFAAAAVPVLKELKPAPPSAGLGHGEPAAADLSGESWTIARKQGKWTAQLASYDGTANGAAEGMTYRLREVPLALPPSVVSHDELAVPWRDIVRVQPGAVDAFSSPNRDMVAIVTEQNIIIYPYADQWIPIPLMTLPLQPKESVVMIQWAMGSYVELWKRQVKTYLQPQ
ncbi:hypothetical protein QJ48_17890 [Paenibacillus sp. A3]|uniref:hypothetical protein n=1 Tax=Paenibacillus sp. A3 TaxID=1337054 RepID=UPI0006D57CCA|nr:hypothetical protein [Paenibacillus sp. A3]KPV58181.1 hypothetical protein QJ48_17890 [Paenibacillus sp. A3]